MSDVYVVRFDKATYNRLSNWVGATNEDYLVEQARLLKRELEAARPEHPERQKLLEEVARAAHIFLNCSLDITQKSARKQLCEVVDKLRSLEAK